MPDHQAAAPNLKIAISDEPKPQIAEDPGGACGYDIWIAHVRAYEEGYAWERQRDFGETVWFYSLDQDPDPYFNPTRIDTQGMHARIIPWAAWAHRITGWAYYDGNRFFAGPNPGVRAALLREGIEDYAYLWLANGSAHPAVFETAAADVTARTVASSMTSWTRDPDALMALRHELGLYIEGSRDTLPELSSGDEGCRAATTSSTSRTRPDRRVSIRSRSTETPGKRSAGNPGTTSAATAGTARTSTTRALRCTATTTSGPTTTRRAPTCSTTTGATTCSSWPSPADATG